MQALDQDMTGAVAPDVDRFLLSFFQNACREGVHLLGVKCFASGNGHVNLVDRHANFVPFQKFLQPK